jgi:nucleotide-binding universal stress UspA family protein
MKLLVAVDFSQASEVALQQIGGRTWPGGTSATVLNVVETALLQGMTDLSEQAVEHATRRVEKAAETLRSRGLDAAPLVLTGAPKTTIVEHAKEMAADFIIIGSHGAGDLARFLLGSVGRAIIHHAPCSVEVVRGAVRNRSDDAAFKILLATDGSEPSLDAARFVAGLSWPKGTEVRVLNVVELIGSLFEAPYIDPGLMEAHRAVSMQRSQSAVAAAEAILSPGGLSLSESISVLLDSPKHVIVREAADWGADLIVVGAHGLSGLERFLLGSVSEAVAMHAGCTVDIIRKRKD